eukprot:CAMPEP_0172159182 /NCGR_PEP_ID=MMETSP1050-20130122/4817_1 /TAXON_ID=233186 /ORGANISM="Cryptomonas curvata, Strain CCAP979/52" /LENGTH=281 /DNA_ID=CAMNT_0012828719 /DNA_START=148 /DNA_END=990 /DNA_ORIENTATION=-
MADAMKLKAAVYRGTTDTGDGEGDPTGIVEINEMIKDKPHLITEAVKYLKARIKDRSPVTSCIAMDLLDQCMQSNGFQFQLYVVKKVLQRILKLALPNKGQHPHVQQKAAALIKFWANSYSADARLFEFSNAAKELARKEEMARGSGAPPGGAVPARQADYSSVRRPDTGSHIPAAAPAEERWETWNPGPEPGVPVGYRGPALAFAPGPFDLEQAKDNLALISAMLAAEDGDPRANEALAEVAMLCRASLAGIMGQIELTQDEAAVVEMLSVHEQLTERIA